MKPCSASSIYYSAEIQTSLVLRKLWHAVASLMACDIVTPSVVNAHGASPPFSGQPMCLSEVWMVDPVMSIHFLRLSRAILFVQGTNSAYFGLIVSALVFSDHQLGKLSAIWDIMDENLLKIAISATPLSAYVTRNVCGWWRFLRWWALLDDRWNY